MQKKLKKLAVRKKTVVLLSGEQGKIQGGAPATAPFFSCRIPCSYNCPPPIDP